MKDLAKRSRLAVTGYYVAHDLRARLAQRSGVAHSAVRTGGHVGADVDAYAHQVFNSTLRHLGFSIEDVRGLRVLELGPGDNLGAAQLMLQAGAREVVALDRFAVDRNGTAPGVTFVEGVGIEDAAEHFGENRFDLIYSIAVLEHVANLNAAFDSMFRLLAPGGSMGHQIGGGDHGMFTDGGHHPLTYMMIPEGLWRAMTAHSGGPNRVLPSTIKELVARYDWSWDLAVTDTITADVDAIRSRLRQPFRDLPAGELLTEGMFLTVRSR